MSERDLYLDKKWCESWKRREPSECEFANFAGEALPYYINLLTTHEPHGHNVTNQQYADCVAELTRAKAENAVMREALEEIVKSDECPYLPCPARFTTRQALSSTAGQDLLAQIEKRKAELKHEEFVRLKYGLSQDIGFEDLAKLHKTDKEKIAELQETLVKIEQRCDWTDRDRSESDKVLSNTQGIRGEIARVYPKCDRGAE